MTVILVVDDETMIAAMIQAVLEDEGYSVCVASNGQEALAVLERQPVDALITDFMMPVMRGDELIARVRVKPTYATLPMILMSAIPNLGERFANLSVTILPKPFDILVLLQHVEALLGVNKRLPV